MIYVRRDPDLIPEGVLRVAERAQEELEALPENERKAFIRKKSHIWKAFKRHLRRMSYGKCWYSESLDPQSFFDVDHFRPKNEAKRAEAEEPDDGYPWLAFSWDNFRYSAARSNRLSTDEDEEITVGKGSWFPLIEGSQKACWEDRCEADEQPLLLDPVSQHDMALVKVDSDGRIQASDFCVGTNRTRVEASVKYYGLDLPNLREARLRTMRDVTQKHEILMQTLNVANDVDDAADHLPLPAQVAALKEATQPDSPYSLAARYRLMELGGAQLVANPEDAPPQ